MTTQKCQIQWIDSAGTPTPDANDAVAVAVSTIRSGGDTTVRKFCICEVHLKQMPKGPSFSRSQTDFRSEWTTEALDE